MQDADYAVVDLETTGFTAGDRIVEVAVLRCRPGSGVIDRFVTLVNPGRPLSAGHVHGLRPSDIGRAPRFADIALQLRRGLADAVIVAHNSRFDVGFLQAELARARVAAFKGPTLCTIALASRLGIPTAGRSLASCCAAFGIAHEPDRAHGAEYDAHATARLLLCLLREARAQGITTLAGLGCASSSLALRPAPPPPPPAAPLPPLKRVAMAVRRLGDESPIDHPALAAYLGLLDRVLLDRVITADEADALCVMARRCELTEDNVARAHTAYVARLAEIAWEDAKLTEAEARDIAHVAALLGVPQRAAHALAEQRGP